MTEKSENIIATIGIIFISIVSFIVVKSLNTIENKSETKTIISTIEKNNDETSINHDIKVSGTSEGKDNTNKQNPSNMESFSGTLLMKREKMLSQESHPTKREYEEVSYSDFFENSMVKYPEILEYPSMLENYVLFVNETKRMKDEAIEMKKYESLWINLYQNNLLKAIETKQIGDYLWSAITLSGNYRGDYQKNYGLSECAQIYGVNKNCFIIVEGKSGVEIIYNVFGEISTFDYQGNKYSLITEKFGDACASGKIYKLYSIEGKFVHKLHMGLSSCESTNNTYTKGDVTIEFVYYSDDYSSYKKGNFQELLVYYKNKLVYKKIFEEITHTFDVYPNLVNGNNLEITIGRKTYLFSEADYINKKEVKSHYGMYAELVKDKKGYKLIGRLRDSFKYNSTANKVSILNCKNNASDVGDEWYTLNKFSPGEVDFIYNISQEYGNYCADGIYTVKIEVEDKKSGKIDEWISEYKLDIH